MTKLTDIGTKLGSYDVQELITQSGTSSIFRGFDTNLQRSVAIKVLSRTAAAQPDFVERFHREARLLAALRHPNIVQVYNFGQQNSSIYMVQEWLPGPTLEQHLRDMASRGERLSRQDIVSITSQLASALDAAHTAGIIHRDVKPANMMWNSAGGLVLTDFGIAKCTLNNTNQTQKGMVLGTPDYLSPEQAQGLPVTPACDIYALGVVLYEMITMRVPFNGTTPMSVVLKHIQEPPPSLRPWRPDIPPAVEGIVNRALAKNPAARFSKAGELARSLKLAWPPTTIAAHRSPAANLHTQATSPWHHHGAHGQSRGMPPQSAALAQHDAPSAGMAPLSGSVVRFSNRSHTRSVMLFVLMVLCAFAVLLLSL